MSDWAFKSVWDAIEDDPAQTANLKHRSALMMAIGEHIKAKGLNQSEAAKLLPFRSRASPTECGARLGCSRSILWLRCLLWPGSGLTKG
jgi:hypothetical protein